MTRQEKIDKASAALSAARIRRGECEGAESAQWDAMMRRPEPAARVEWVRRLDVLHDAMLDEADAAAAVREANASQDDPKPAPAAPVPPPAAPAAPAAPVTEPGQ